MFKLEKKANIDKSSVFMVPLSAIGCSLIFVFILFILLGKNPTLALFIIFIEPLLSVFGISELIVKSTPLIIIALGLSFGFRAGVWNIGAEGQYTIGALSGGATILAFYPMSGLWLLPVAFLVAIISGALWGMIPGILKAKFNTNEILVSLMLTYVAILFLSAMVYGPLKDPDGFNFPESRLFHDSGILPIIFHGTRAHVGFLIAIFLVVMMHFLLTRHMVGFFIKVSGESPRALLFSGKSRNQIIYLSFIICGGLAGLAGVIEVSGPIGQLVPAIPVGYGFTAIIVAFLGRLNPVGIFLAGLLLALTYIGGEAAQIKLGLPNAITGVFQGVLLFFLLAADAYTKYKISLVNIRWKI
ncbi:MAG: ABC transporter permease [Hyphomicrobiales bacterium]|jgi:general nucleoside transport system permease protein|nr:ABC transporter permease [Hyphomicrobiales bacterium]